MKEVQVSTKDIAKISSTVSLYLKGVKGPVTINSDRNMTIMKNIESGEPVYSLMVYSSSLFGSIVYALDEIEGIRIKSKLYSSNDQLLGSSIKFYESKQQIINEYEEIMEAQRKKSSLKDSIRPSEASNEV